MPLEGERAACSLGCWSLDFPLVDKELRDAQAGRVHLRHYIVIFRLRIIQIFKQILRLIVRKIFKKIVTLIIRTKIRTTPR